jgi:hypothetical protein
VTCPLVFISLCLPYQFSSFSFLRFCFERGYLLSSTAKGDYGKLENYPRRPFDELWPEGSEHLPVPDWKGFRRIWEERVPKLRIRNKSEDTCPECFILKNKFKYLGSRKRQPDDVDDPDAAVTTDPFINDDENLLFDANTHAEQAKQQRDVARERQETAIQEANNEHEDRRFVFCFIHSFSLLLFLTLFFFFFPSYCMVCDYAQNLGLPHFGEEQPADIYYFSELTVNIFGIADVTKKPTKMLAYGYTEDQGGKGGNNVASLVMRGLHDLGWIKSNRTGKRLSIIMDNCGGQNKNKFVLRLALMLVELQHFRVVELLFYIRGHTKNACDRLFNQLKKRWHKRQVFTMTQVCCRILLFFVLLATFIFC